MTPHAILITKDRALREKISDLLPGGGCLVCVETIDAARKELLRYQRVSVLVIDVVLTGQIEAEVMLEFRQLDAERIVFYVSEVDLPRISELLTANAA